MLVYWRPDQACPVIFPELFSSPTLHYLNAKALQNESLDPTATVFSSAQWYDDIWFDYASADFPWESFSALAVDFLRSLLPIASVRQVVDTFALTHRLHERVGVHIRHTDNIGEYGHWASASIGRFESPKISQLKGFFMAMEAISSTTGFFLSTDNPHIAEDLQMRYGPRLVILPKTFRDPQNLQKRQRTTGIDMALADLLLLGRCREIIGTYYSSFSKLAAILGDVPYSEIQGRERNHRPQAHTRSRRINLRTLQ
jgi:hypothetical protein